MTEKIQKILSRNGIGSRRNIENLILSNKIIINGRLVVIGQRMFSKHIKHLLISGKDYFICNKIQKFNRLLLYNKPISEICSKKDEKDRNIVYKTLPKLKNAAWVSVGRLDINSSGLLLFTTNGNFANFLMHPSSNIQKTYIVRVFGNVSNKKIDYLKSGIVLDGHHIKVQYLKLLKNTKKVNTWLKISLYEGRNREIRRLLNKVNLQVNRLIRISYGHILLPKFLSPGKWIELNFSNIASKFNFS